MCWYHDSKSNWEASDGSLPGMWKLVIILNNFRTSTFICQFLFPPRSWTWLQGCPDLGDIRRRRIPSVLHWVSCSRGTAPGNGLCPLADHRRTAGTSQCRLPQGTWTLPCFEAKHQNPLSTIWEDKSRSFVHLPFNFKYLSEKRETRIMRDAAMVMTAQRTDRTLTMMVQHIFTVYSTPFRD